MNIFGAVVLMAKAILLSFGLLIFSDDLVCFTKGPETQ